MEANYKRHGKRNITTGTIGEEFHKTYHNKRKDLTNTHLLNPYTAMSVHKMLLSIVDYPHDFFKGHGIWN